MGLAARDIGAPAGIYPVGLVLSSAALSELELAREQMRDAEAAVTRGQDEVAAINERIDAAKVRLDSLHRRHRSLLPRKITLLGPEKFPVLFCREFLGTALKILGLFRRS